MKSFRTICAISLLLSISPSVHPHVRWFIEGKSVPDVSFSIDMINILTLIAAAGLVTVSWFFHKSKSNLLSTLLNKPLVWPCQLDWYLMVLLLNLTLVTNLMMGDFIAPNLLIHPQWIMLGIIIQFAAILVSAISISITGIALILVGIGLPLFFPTASGFDYFFEVTGVGLAYLLIGPCINRVDRKLHHHFDFLKCYNLSQLIHGAISVIRIALGLQLMALAIHNKLIQPGAALVFLQEYPFYNFMQLSGFSSFSHLNFVFAAGVFELVLGALLVAGWAPRFIALCLSIIFITTTLVSGLPEVFGHLPIFGVLIIILSAGSITPREKRKKSSE